MLTNRTADCAKLIIGADTYATEMYAKKKIKKDAGVVLKKYSKDADELMLSIVEEASKAPSSGMPVSTLMDRYHQFNWSTSNKLDVAVELLGRFLHRVRTQPSIVSKAESRARDTLKGLAGLSSDPSYADVFAVPSASKIRFFKTWHQDALDSLAVDEVEEIRTEMLLDREEEQDIISLASEIKDLDRDIRVNGITKAKETLRASMEARLFEMAGQSEDRKAALSTAAKVLFKNESYASETGKKISEQFGGLTEEQETAMVAEGKILIAAGAGSGKTKVLAGKVAYHAVEQGVPLKNIIAVAFNKKASAELRERIIRYGGPQMEPIHGMPNFKTTHSFSIRVINDALKSTGGRRKGLLTEDAEIQDVLDEAIRQVSVGNFGPELESRVEQTGGIGFVPQGFFDTQKASRMSPVEAKIENFIKDAVNRMIHMANVFARSTDPADKKRLDSMLSADNAVFSPIARWAWDGSIPTDVKPYSMWTQSEKDGVNAYIEGRAGGRSKTRASKALEVSGLGSSYRFANQIAIRPLNQWFNLGVPGLITEIRNPEDSTLMGFDVNKESELLEDVEQFIGDCLANLVSPEQALDNIAKGLTPTGEDLKGENERFFSYANKGVVQAAVYGAFQYIKGMRNVMTFDDSLVLASKALIENPGVLQSYIETYTHILVDEAQDLNKAQHLLFGLIAGHVNPSTAKPYGGEHKMNANVFAFIGDDKQAIYEFRGARPQEFIEKSDLKKGDFRTMILNTNFRSGRRILEAANNLIAYNTDQIPMVCNANPANDDGSISYTIGDIRSQQAQMDACKEIADLIEAEGFDQSSYRAGVICRTNKELAPFALGLISRGIPFYSKKPLLNVPSLNAMLNLAYVKSARKDLNTTGMLGLTEGSVDKAFEVSYKLDKVFRNRLNNLIAQYQPASPIDWFIQTGWNMIYTGNQSFRNQKDCKALADLLFAIRSYAGSPSDLMSSIRTGLFLPVKFVEESVDDEGNTKEEDDAGIVGSVLQNIFDRYDNLEEALDFCSEIKKISKSSSSKEQSERRDVVFLGTAHGWKGLEADQMWMVMDNDTFPHPKALEKPEGMAEERRLAYVALTRGKQGVNIITSFVTEDDQGKKRGGPSPFIGEACVKSAPGTPSFPHENITDVNVDEEMEEMFKMAGKIDDLTFRLQRDLFV